MSLGDTRYLALLRGINVGGKNVITMADLKECFSELGFTQVTTYIQSGNVFFSTSKTSSETLSQTIESQLHKRYAASIRALVLTYTHIKKIVARAPRGFGDDPDNYRYDVLFLMKPLMAEHALRAVPLRDGVDHVWKGPTVLYHSRLIERASQSKLSQVVGMPMYQSMTIRNFRTTIKLYALMRK